MSRISLKHLRQMKVAQEKIAVLTAYDASFSYTSPTLTIINRHKNVIKTL